MRAQALADGAPPEYLDAIDAMADGDEGDCEVWPENWDAVLAFLGLQTCWRRQYLDMAGQIVWEGLGWGDVTALLRETHPQRSERRTLIEDLRVMETAALELLNKPTK